MSGYGIIFITANEIKIDPHNIYNYNDAIYVNEDDESDVLMCWSGQKRHRRDYIVTDGNKEVHVFSRSNQTNPYKYRGIIKNDTIARVVEGNATLAFPSSYQFKLETKDLPMPYGFETASQRSAVNDIGFTFTFNCNGIYEMTPK